MPKPREIAREQRRLGRHLATRDALAAMVALAPSAQLPPEALAGYTEQAKRIAQWFSRAHRLSAALSDRPGTEGETDPER